MLEVLLTNAGQRTTVSCEAILFDMDGTLVDSRLCVEGVWRDWADRHGLDARRILAVAHGRQNHDVLELVAPHLDVARELAWLTRAEEERRDGIVAVPGARELLDSLAEDRWAIVTSAWKTLAEIRLRCAGTPLPKVLITAEDVRRGKPHPDGYLTAAARLQVAPAACLVFEDAHAGVEAARAAGMVTVGLTTTFSAKDLGCQWCIDDFRTVSVARHQR